MNVDRVWDGPSRDRLRDDLRSHIVGELRLAKRDHEEILQACDEIYILDECPDDERGAVLRFAAEEMERIAAELAIEAKMWPEETDCDRLDRVELELRNRGIVFWQASPCCDNCTLAESTDRIDAIEEREPGFSERLRGYAFFIDQNLPERLAESTTLSVYLAYGWRSPDDSHVTDAVYRDNALGIAREVCHCLRLEGFEPDWNGDLGKKIGVMLNWRRRKLLDSI